MKECTKCGEEKDVSQFYSKTPTCLDSSCKSCKIKYAGVWSQQNKDKKRAAWARYKERHPNKVREHGRTSAATYRLTVGGRANDILNRMSRRSADKGFPPPELSRGDIEEALTLGVCQQTHIPFDLSPPIGNSNNPFAPSPDRIDPKVGYTKANTQFVCWMYNAMKSDFSPEDVGRFVSALITTHKHKENING